jgi:hypothetical protein
LLGRAPGQDLLELRHARLLRQQELEVQEKRSMKNGMDLTFEDALRIARGCTDYGGVYRSDPEQYEIYQAGIRTVIRALETALEMGLSDPQTRALYFIGKEDGLKRKETPHKT